MNERLTIGVSTVQFVNAGALPETLHGLRRMPAADDAPVDATIEVAQCLRAHWPLDVTERGDLHCFGRPAYALEVEPLERRARLLLAEPFGPNDLYWFQRDLFGILACMAGQIMLHGSAVAAPGGGAWIFCGPSGAGKSTLCRMLAAAGMAVINDEINWLFDGADGALRIVNQPYWFGRADTPSLPVARLHYLSQGPRCALGAALPKIEAFMGLLAAHLSIDTRYDFLETRAMALKRLVENRPIETLEFNLDTQELLGVLCEV